MNFARRDPVGARTGGCEQGFTQYHVRYYYRHVHTKRAPKHAAFGDRQKPRRVYVRN